MRNEDQETVIDLGRLLKAVLKKLWIVILCMLIGGVGAFAYTYFLVTPLYQSKVLLYVNNSSISVGSTKVSISAADISAAQSLVDTYSVILKTRNTIEEIIDKYDLPYDYDELSAMISSAAVNNTEILAITVTSSDPKEAEEIANAIGTVLPIKISDIVEGSSVKIVDYAVVPSVKTSPNVTKNTFMGAFIGLVLSVLVICGYEIMNDEVKEERDLTDRFEYPILASIPDLRSRKTIKYGKGDK